MASVWSIKSVHSYSQHTNRCPRRPSHRWWSAILPKRTSPPRLHSRLPRRRPRPPPVPIVKLRATLSSMINHVERNARSCRTIRKIRSIGRNDRRIISLPSARASNDGWTISSWKPNSPSWPTKIRFSGRKSTCWRENSVIWPTKTTSNIQQSRKTSYSFSSPPLRPASLVTKNNRYLRKHLLSRRSGVWNYSMQHRIHEWRTAQEEEQVKITMETDRFHRRTRHRQCETHLPNTSAFSSDGSCVKKRVLFACHFLDCVHSKEIKLWTVQDSNTDGEKEFDNHVVWPRERTRCGVAGRERRKKAREGKLYFESALLMTIVKQHESLRCNLDNSSALSFHNVWSGGIVHEISFDSLISNDWSSIPIVRFHWYFSLRWFGGLSERCDFGGSKQAIRTAPTRHSITSRAQFSASVNPSWMLSCRALVPEWEKVCFKELNNDEARVSK